VTDEALMQQFCAGDEKAFDELFCRHAVGLRRYLRRVTGSALVADDLVQTTFLSVVRARGRFRPDARFRPWLYAIATNATRDLFRRTKHERVTRKGSLPDEGVEPEMKDPGLERAVRDALARLPEGQREAIMLHRFEGFSFAEIAVVAGLSESAAKVRAHRGYEALRVLLRATWEGEQRDYAPFGAAALH
jgi:RNA polymerase sigma factor (sigma-70 family)